MTLIMYPRHGNSKCFSRTLFKHSQHAVTLRDFLSYSSCLKLNECTDQGSFQFLCTYVIFPTDGNRPAKWWKTGCESNICCALRDIVAGKLCYSGTGIGNKAGLSIDILNYNDTKFCSILALNSSIYTWSLNLMVSHIFKKSVEVAGCVGKFEPGNYQVQKPTTGPSFRLVSMLPSAVKK